MITGHKVKPCPRCGAEKTYLHISSKSPFAVQCWVCGAFGPAEETAEAAVTAWNAQGDDGKAEKWTSGPIDEKKEEKMPDTIDNSEACDYESLRKGIVGVLKRYYATDDVGEPNKEYDGEYTADEAVDDIRKIVGIV